MLHWHRSAAEACAAARTTARVPTDARALLVDGPRFVQLALLHLDEGEVTQGHRDSHVLLACRMFLFANS